MGAALLLLRAVLGACPLPVSGGGSCAPPWPQVVRLLSCSRDPTASLTDCRKVSFHLGVPWGHLNLAGRKLFPAWLCVRSLPGHLAKQG